MDLYIVNLLGALLNKYSKELHIFYIDFVPLNTWGET
jgi:hypothetical protein